jgi:hypothetical protein
MSFANANNKKKGKPAGNNGYAPGGETAFG